MSVYWKYIRAGGGCCSAFILCINLIITQILFNGSEYWLTLWTNAEERRGRINQTLTMNEGHNMTDADGEWHLLEDLDTYTGIYVFSGLIGGVFVFSMIRTVHFFVSCMLASIHLHNAMFHSVIRAPLKFFDHNPVGKDFS